MEAPLCIIGYGNMSGAMLAGWLAAGASPSQFNILNRSAKEGPKGVRVYSSIADAEASAPHGAIMLGFKPHQMGEAAADLQELSNRVPVYSLLAGITLAQLREAFPKASAHVRVMPNLASRVNKSPVILAECGLDDDGKAAAFSLFDQLGKAVWLHDEAQYDLATALAGSGPGFVYRFIDALAGAARELGLDETQAQSLALAMVEGAASLASASDDTPRVLADKVASPGGMTREGLNVLDENAALQRLLTETLRKTRDRGAELSADRN
ncbi:pyrroline-5-carboxylate reductase [Erythrobacter sp. YT30]|uniref:pyrroline-5-carboxylate reductase family protein n=1 Tax=Erythrobacter sp. YT30 TaxID=1735012 RepID=UPI00076D7B25|nr:pyrroline-5-carboxylate reductase [Erythrobacter sp. YT30]KWV90626.1 pyrroline-5-carboxylate reductase [Erythrobacter sp. YT30]